MREIKIYTKHGDNGSSRTLVATKRNKGDAIFHAIGDVDELNTVIGLACHALTSSTNTTRLETVQSDLFTIGAILAGGTLAFSPAHVTALEQHIDRVQATVPPLTQFILPRGNTAAVRLHHARAVCRRAERHIAAVANDTTPAALLAYMNRLSDLLFVLARAENTEPECIWRAPRNKNTATEA